MDWLIDSNILVRALDRSHPQYTPSRQAVRDLLMRGDSLHITLQGLAEFWNVCTRPSTARGGLNLSRETTDRRLRFGERISVFSKTLRRYAPSPRRSSA